MEWVFEGGRRCLDLVNTMRDRHLEGRELLVDADALAEWLRHCGYTVNAIDVTERQVSAVRALREAIDRLTMAVSDRRRPSASDVALVNTTAAAIPAPALHLADDGSLTLANGKGTLDSVLAVFAVDAIELVTTTPAVRVCAADDCGLRFLDASPKRNRQWCSMARCGNRAKARAHYARRRLSGESPRGGAGTR
ncbi:ABATE domain-containing protein [Saccharomonospora sp. NPDC006951]